MTVDQALAQRWLDAYVGAWESYEPDAIGELFSEDAEYLWHPWDSGDAVARGRQAIVRAWLENRDQPGTYTGRYEPMLVHGQTVISVGTSRYYTDPTRRHVDREYRNLWILEFDAAGRCRSFTEWFMKAPKPRQSKPGPHGPG